MANDIDSVELSQLFFDSAYEGMEALGTRMDYIDGVLNATSGSFLVGNAGKEFVIEFTVSRKKD